MKTTLILILIAYCMTCCGKDEVKNSSPDSTTITPTDLNGRDGAAGQAGKDGKDGVAGVAGTNGKDGTTTEANQWNDLVTGKQWVMGAQGTQLSANTVCSGTYRAPTISELSDACFRGLFKVYTAKLGAPSVLVSWASTNGDVITISSCAASTQGNGTPAVIVCVQK